MEVWWIWVGIAICLSQSAMLSGLNLAVFSLSRLRLEAAAASGDAGAQSVLALRQDANYTLATILWANVGVNVLLTLLAESVLAGVAAFLFSTVLITFIGEIFPQAYFTRYALHIVAWLAPALKLYRLVLWPIAKPVGLMLDWLVGKEAIPWFREEELSDLLEHHGRADESEVGRVEATGAINFLALDDLPLGQEGEPIDPDTIIELSFERGRPRFPEFTADVQDAFLRRIAEPERKWRIIVDEAGEPRRIFSAPAFVSAALSLRDAFDPVSVCHYPLIVRDATAPLGQMLSRFQVWPEKPGDDVVDIDVILVWDRQVRKIITGSDILGRLLRRIVRVR